ncbi:hypothetical protein [Aurantiacibacter sediminis]|uniref:Uncharacterized protein n=1 Tax=Aurantiacibacter sediminis TaxID=2793064 RepID=A0ABS0N3E0_9SPHN|nr:hypothetical protein [Aurantiacibacter sediminis]MBH5322472.1 hypothetical protein [Aurantiacibacter sediminis]
MEANSLSERVRHAMARIDAAAQRIEAAANAPRPASGPGSDPELEARYAELQREAGEALQQIDRLIGTLER